VVKAVGSGFVCRVALAWHSQHQPTPNPLDQPPRPPPSHLSSSQRDLEPLAATLQVLAFDAGRTHGSWPSAFPCLHTLHATAAYPHSYPPLAATFPTLTEAVFGDACSSIPAFVPPFASIAALRHLVGCYLQRRRR